MFTFIDNVKCALAVNAVACWRKELFLDIDSRWNLFVTAE